MSWEKRQFHEFSRSILHSDPFLFSQHFTENKMLKSRANSLMIRMEIGNALVLIQTKTLRQSVAISKNLNLCISRDKKKYSISEKWFDNHIINPILLIPKVTGSFVVAFNKNRIGNQHLWCTLMKTSNLNYY